MEELTIELIDLGDYVYALPQSFLVSSPGKPYIYQELIYPVHPSANHEEGQIVKSNKRLHEQESDTKKTG